MTNHVSNLRSYYEEEARLRLRKQPTGRRVALRDGFIDLVRREGRQSVLDFGSGPGGDGPSFRDAGLRYVGLDLAYGNARLAADEEVVVVQGSIQAPPFRPRSFDAGWSMSTLMHLPESEVVEVLRAMALVLKPAAPLVVGLWGGERRDVVDDEMIDGHRRLYSFRPLDRNRKLLATCGVIEDIATWNPGSPGQEYQTFRLRIRA